MSRKFCYVSKTNQKREYDYCYKRYFILACFDKICFLEIQELARNVEYVSFGNKTKPIRKIISVEP